MLVVRREDIGLDGVFSLRSQFSKLPVRASAGVGYAHGWDLARELDRFGDGQNAFLYGAFEVDVLDLLAEIRLCVDETDQAVLDL